MMKRKLNSQLSSPRLTTVTRYMRNRRKVNTVIGDYKDAASRYQFLRQGDEIAREMRLMSSVSAADVDCLENLAVYMQQHGGEAYVIEGGREVGVLELAEARQAYNLRSNDAGYTKGSDKPAVSVTPKAADLSEVDNDDEEQKRPADTTANADLDHAGQEEAERLIGDKLVVHEGQTSAGFIDYNNDGDNDHDAMKADDHDMDDVFHEMESNGNRFIERMYFKVREGVLAGDVETRYINTKQNPSDLFTKDVPREVVEVLGPMLTGEAAWPDTPESEDALKAQIADMRLCV
eukprot:COSAG06_NODE_2630_length_6548_cov_3.312045_5_plen_291_part_00